MENREKPEHQSILRLLPSVDALLRSETAVRVQSESGAKYLTGAARQVVEMMRREIIEKENNNFAAESSRADLLAKAENYLAEFHQKEEKIKLQKVINVTGVIVHTNLGRAPLSENARRAMVEAAGYCNLEYDIENGKRGRRGRRADKLLANLTGAEDALVVNNCAAAAFIVLNVLAAGGEVIVSRGELVEIGGDFRVPDVMAQSGATLREVGTTNRTKISDYENAIGENTRLLAKIHPSNFRIKGFTKSVGIAELAKLSRERNIPLYEDAGSGAIFDFSKYGLTDEPIISKSIESGADVVTFSGDKLLGGAQSGLIVGRREIIEKIRKHTLYRILRVNKLIYAALEATLEAFQRETAEREIPVLQMLAQTAEQLKKRTENFAGKLSENANLLCEIAWGKSVIGGGSAPDVEPETMLLLIRHQKLTAEKFERELRFSDPPVIARILADKIAIDLRTVSEAEEAELSRVLRKI